MSKPRFAVDVTPTKCLIDILEVPENTSGIRSFLADITTDQVVEIRIHTIADNNASIAMQISNILTSEDGRKLNISCRCLTSIGMFGAIIAASCKHSTISSSSTVTMRPNMHAFSGLYTLESIDEARDVIARENAAIATLFRNKTGKTSPWITRHEYTSDQVVALGLFDSIDDSLHIKQSPNPMYS